MSGLDPRQLLVHVVRPTLAVLDLPGGVLAEKLVMGTACQESDGFRYIHQLGKGPALSLWQIEPATAKDALARCSDGLFIKVAHFVSKQHWMASDGLHAGLLLDLPGNLYLGAAMCRLVYYMKAFKMATAKDLELTSDQRSWCAVMWKKHYNTVKGAGTEAQFLKHWDEHKLDSLWP